ncbi:MAG: tetratricopeptide repeat protein [Bacteroidetes bacterium]|nr:tetratricopeptide repeat protein [Bacteroidota bacterium]
MSYAQQIRIDSLKTLLEKDKEDTSKVGHLNMIAQLISPNNPDKAIELSNEALKLADKIRWEIGIYQSMYQIGVAHFNAHNSNEAINFFFKALQGYEKLEKQNDKNIISIVKEKKAKIFGNIGSAYQDLGNFPLALKFQFKAVESFIQNNDSNFLAGTYGNIGILCREQGNYPLSLDYYFKALDIKEK